MTSHRYQEGAHIMRFSGRARQALRQVDNGLRESRAKRWAWVVRGWGCGNGTHTGWGLHGLNFLPTEEGASRLSYQPGSDEEQKEGRGRGFVSF